MQIIRCRDARAQGLKRYYTGKPCKRGHVAERHVNGGCVVCANEDQKRYYDANPEKYLAANRKWHQDPLNKILNRIRQSELYEANPELFRSISARCRAARLKRVPPWSQTEAIKEFYKNCPEGHEVDHIIPLQGKLISGLHVLQNLQYLPKLVNRAKGNKFDAYLHGSGLHE